MSSKRGRIPSLAATIGLVWCLGIFWSPAAHAAGTVDLPDPSGAVDSASDAASGASDAVSGAASDAVDSASGAVGSALDAADGATGTDTGDTVGGVVEGVGDTVGDVVGAVTGTVDETVDGAVAAVDEVTDTVSDATGGATDPIIDPIEGALDPVGPVVDDVTDQVEEVVDTAPGTVTGSVAGGAAGGGRGRSAGIRPDALLVGGETAGTSSEQAVATGSGVYGTSEGSRLPGPGAAGREAQRLGAVPTPGSVALDAFAQSLPPAASALLRAAASDSHTDLGAATEPSFLERAAELTKHIAFPLALAMIVAGFLALQSKLDRDDPKLALAPVDQDQEVLYFE